MILRGAVLSEKRVHLEGAPAERERAIPTSSRAVSLAREPVREPVAIPAPVTQSEPMLTPRALLEMAAPQLSFDAVSDWLEEASEVTRSAVAALLAADIEVLRTTARSEGLVAGHSEGVAQGLAAAQEQASQTQQDLEKTLTALEKVTAAAETAFGTELEQLANQCAEVVMATLLKVAGPALSSPEAIVGAVLEVLHQVKEEREVTIRVAAIDLPTLQAAEARIGQALAGRKFALVSDRRVEVGGCIVESSLGSLDGRLEQQVRALGETIRAAKGTALGSLL
jgi:flagellar assembly protein FliH